jgi:hypothetical protein
MESVSDDRASTGAPVTLLTLLTQWADGIARLDPDHPPGDVPLGRWRQLLADARRLFDDVFGHHGVIV